MHKKIITSLLIAALIAVGIYVAVELHMKENSLKRPVVTATPHPASPTNWNTYTNTEFGFEMKYPPNFTLTFSNGGGEGEIAFKIIEFGKPRTLPTFQLQIHNLVSEDVFMQGTKTQINGLDVYFSDHSWQDITNRTNHAYSWTFIDPQHKHWYRLDMGQDKNEQLVNQILSSFRFTK